MRGYAEPVNLLTNYPLVIGGRTTISDPLPVGEGWYRGFLRINIIEVVGTGAGAVTEGELLFIKNILFKTDRGEIVCNLPGRALYKVGVFKSGIVAPPKDAIAAGSATYHVRLPIWFADHYDRLDRPEDTILDTKRYSSLSLEITLGTTADLMTAPGTATVTATADFEVIRTKGLLPDKAGPIAMLCWDYKGPVDATVAQAIFLERAQDLSYKALYAHSCTNTGTAGDPFSGVNGDALQNLVSIKDQSGYIIKDRIHDMIQFSNCMDYSLPTYLVGWEAHNFVQEGSIQAALATAGKSLLQYSWTNQAGVAATCQVTLVQEGVRGLK